MKKFFRAVIDENLEDVILLHKKKPYLIHARDENGFTPLMWAVSKGNTELVRYLISRGADVNTTVPTTGTAVVHFAAEGGSVETLKLLVADGADLGVVNLENYSCLHFAAMGGYSSMVEFLLNSGLDIHLKTTDTSDTPLHAAAKFGHIEVLETLLQRGADIDAINQDVISERNGGTAFTIAVHHWNIKLIRTILNFQKKNPDNFIYSRILSNVFNDQYICELLETDGHNYTDGGTYYEALRVMIRFLQEYIKSSHGNKSLIQILTNLISLNETCASQSQPDFISEDTKATYFYTGFKGHVLYGSIVKNDPKITFSFCESGFFNNKAEQGKVYPFSRIETNDIVAAQETLQALTMMNEVCAEDAAKILYTKIPTLLKSSYQIEDQIKKKPFKRGRCYFENLKLLMLSEMIRILGIKKGRECYRNFNRFMCLSATKNFADKVTHNNESGVLAICYKKLSKQTAKSKPKNDHESKLIRSSST